MATRTAVLVLVAAALIGVVLTLHHGPRPGLHPRLLRRHRRDRGDTRRPARRHLPLLPAARADPVHRLDHGRRGPRPGARVRRYGGRPRRLPAVGRRSLPPDVHRHRGDPRHRRRPLGARPPAGLRQLHHPAPVRPGQHSPGSRRAPPVVKRPLGRRRRRAPPAPRRTAPARAPRRTVPARTAQARARAAPWQNAPRDQRDQRDQRTSRDPWGDPRLPSPPPSDPRTRPAPQFQPRDRTGPRPAQGDRTAPRPPKATPGTRLPAQSARPAPRATPATSANSPRLPLSTRPEAPEPRQIARVRPARKPATDAPP